MCMHWYQNSAYVVVRGGCVKCKTLGTTVGLIDLAELRDLSVSEDDSVVAFNATGVTSAGNARSKSGVVTDMLVGQPIVHTHATRSLPSR